MKAPRSPKYRFGPFAFGSKQAISQHAREMRERYAARQPIASPGDRAFLEDLFRCNAETAEKGLKVEWFFWARSPDHPTPCFWIRRADGSECEFGLGACLDGIDRLNRQSLRAAVRADVDAFRAARLAAGTTTFVSEFSGLVFPAAEAEVDHVTPFDQIIDQFFSARQIDLASSLLTAAVDRRSEPVWKDPGLIADFRMYHRDFPLRLVHRRENQSDIKRTHRPRKF